MAKKNPIKNYDPSINFRLSKELKETIEEKAQSKNLTTSNYVRDLLESVHTGNYCNEKEVKSERESFLYSKEFLQLMIWIYKKRNNKKLEVGKHELNKYIRTLKRVEEYLPQEIVDEFDKVLNDVLLLKADTSYLAKTEFDFHNSIYDYKGINLELIEKFFLSNNNLETYIEGFGDYVYNENDIEM